MLVKFNQVYQALMEAKTIDEIKEIHDKAEALRLYVRQQGQGLEMQNACAEIKLRAERRAGELLKEIERSQGERTDLTSCNHCTKLGEFSHTIKEANISHRTAYNWQIIADLPETDFEEEIQETKSRGQELTSSRMLQRARRHIAGDKPPPPPMTTGKYRIIYADPPWKYGNTMPEYFTEQVDYYPLMTLEEITTLPVKDISEDNAVLFLWVTSPILEDSFKVINAWGFKYKASFVWDKIKHNMGHYNSVRHEFLLICVRGSCQPDVKQLFDSVQSIERTRHSEKPEKFREIIDTIYPNGERIELFARRQIEGWETYSNELSRCETA